MSFSTLKRPYFLLRECNVRNIIK